MTFQWAAPSSYQLSSLTLHLVTTLHTGMSPWGLKLAVVGTDTMQTSKHYKAGLFSPGESVMNTYQHITAGAPGPWELLLCPLEYRRWVSPGSVSYLPHHWAANTLVWGADKMGMR